MANKQREMNNILSPTFRQDFELPYYDQKAFVDEFGFLIQGWSINQHIYATIDCQNFDEHEFTIYVDPDVITSYLFNCIGNPYAFDQLDIHHLYNITQPYYENGAIGDGLRRGPDLLDMYKLYERLHRTVMRMTSIKEPEGEYIIKVDWQKGDPPSLSLIRYMQDGILKYTVYEQGKPMPKQMAGVLEMGLRLNMNVPIWNVKMIKHESNSGSTGMHVDSAINHIEYQTNS